MYPHLGWWENLFSVRGGFPFYSDTWMEICLSCWTTCSPSCVGCYFFLSAAVLSAINTTYFRLILQGNNFQYNLVVNSLQAFGYSLKLFAANLGRPEPLKWLCGVSSVLKIKQKTSPDLSCVAFGASQFLQNLSDPSNGFFKEEMLLCDQGP